jgi:hypothetical protein
MKHYRYQIDIVINGVSIGSIYGGMYADSLDDCINIATLKHNLHRYEDDFVTVTAFEVVKHAVHNN